MHLNDMSILRSRALAKAGAALLLFALAFPAHADRVRPFASALWMDTEIIKCMALGDVNEDGRADLVMSAYNVSSVSLLLGTSAGEFGPLQWLGLLPKGTTSNIVDLIDLDADGHLDLVIAASESLHVFAGDGTGVFASPRSVPFPTGPLDANIRAWNDVDDDGHLDLLAPCSGATGAVLLAHGIAGGSFTAPETLWMPRAADLVRMADANGDGRLDLFTIDGGGNSVCLRMANAGGVWSPPLTLAVPAVRAVADQDGDGFADLWSFTNRDTRVWRGAGDGSFTAGPPSAVMGMLFSNEPVVADQDGDGRNDLLGTAIFRDQGALVLLRSRPDGSLALVERWGVGGSPYPFGVADFDGDGLLDAVTGSRDERSVQVMLGLGPERFAGRTLYESGVDATAPSGVALADLDRDGRADLLFANSYGNQLTVYHSQASGRMQYLQDIHTPTYPEAISVADLDDDGWLDVAIAGGDGPIAGQAFALNQRNGSLNPAIVLDGLTRPSAIQALAGQFDLDGKIDLLYAGTPNPRIAFGLGGGAFEPLDSISFSGCSAPRVAVGRIDLGPIDDLVFISGQDSIGVALANGQRGFDVMPRTFIGGDLSDIVSRDLDADGRADVVALDAASSSVVVLRSVVFGRFLEPVRYSVGQPGTRAFSLATGDIDLDGFIDLVVSNTRRRGDHRPATATVWFNDQHGAFTQRADFVTGPNGGRLSLGDIDGNGTLDLAVANGRGELSLGCGYEVSVFLNTSLSPPASVGTPLAAPTAFALPRAWPNPLRHGEDLRLDLLTRTRGEVVVELLDLQGRRVREQSYRALNVGRHSLTLPIQGIAPGLYFVRATQGSQRASQRVVVL